jgi:hypothetical protein
MKLLDFQIRSALAEHSWDEAARLLAGAFAEKFPQFNCESAIDGASFCTTPNAGKLLEVQIRYRHDVIFWQNGKTGFYHYPVNYVTPMVLIFAPGCL